MLHHHIVMVTPKNYKLMQSFPNRLDAINFLSSRSCSSFAVIYRDGVTGKRYTYNEAKNFIKGD